MTLYEQWIEAKEAENEIIARRRAIEDEIAKSLQITDDWEGSYTMKNSGFKINVKRAFARKVDDKILSSIADEYGLQDYLPKLFRWKPEVNLKTWKETDADITSKLAMAITTTPGRVSFKIEKEEI